MNASMNETVSGEVRDYVLQVRAALSDLPAEDVEEFTTGMEADLGERLAEPGAGTLRDRLGEPEAYATELRSAAGLPSRVAPVQAKTPVAQRLSAWWAGERERVLVAMPWLRDLRPLWWAVRGFSLASVLADMLGTGIMGLGFVGAVASVAAGLMARHGKLSGAWLRPVRVLLNVAAVLLLPLALAMLADRGSSSGESYAEPGFAVGPGLISDGEPVMNLYAYDETGRRLDRVRIMDQQGNWIAIDPWTAQQGMTEQEVAVAFDPETGEPQFDPTVFPMRWGAATGWEGIPVDGRWEPPVAIAPLPGPVPSVEPSASPSPSASVSPTPTPQTSSSSGVSATPAPTPSSSPSPSASR